VEIDFRLFITLLLTNLLRRFTGVDFGVNAAVEAAKHASISWSETSPIKRSRILFKFRELLEYHRLQLASFITQEHGKILSDVMGKVAHGIEVVEFTYGIPHFFKTQFLDNIGGDIH
jgi:malonate-semialdehyde dehydrogenase (acetylating)/methylmalonate-semialdehyde dehydrogenase